MREIRQSGSEGGARSIPRPYPYRTANWKSALQGNLRYGESTLQARAAGWDFVVAMPFLLPQVFQFHGGHVAVEKRDIDGTG